MRHDRQRPYRQCRIGNKVDRHVVGQVVYKWTHFGDPPKCFFGLHLPTPSRILPRAWTGPAPAPTSSRPYSTASEATTRARRAAYSASKPKARKLAKAEEWVQPAP